VIDQARSDATLSGGYVPIDLYATNKVCHDVCEVAIENSGGVVLNGPSGGRYARWLGTVW
jgi:hypothetical protein